jgi:hypothetical protein
MSTKNLRNSILELIANNSKEPSPKKRLIYTAKQLLADVESGKINAFACVGLNRDGTSRIYQDAYGCSKYELFGALSHYQQNYMCLEDFEPPKDIA